MDNGRPVVAIAHMTFGSGGLIKTIENLKAVLRGPRRVLFVFEGPVSTSRVF
jgi:hypothetical protein